MELSENFISAALDCKSRPIYEKWFKMYADFKKENEASEDSIAIYMDFIMKLSTHYKLNSLWQAASCVNKQLLLSKYVKHIVDPEKT